ncbi:unnamed protein product [Prorocentrum cordatum]|uniref:Uncharacterized protein n=1 Tax=Prorocentrum cordatum TaxID=2364126 RepID=A0ABN9W126_9DINO|nr:unnamed protein product [Polarella glacialis]
MPWPVAPDCYARRGDLDPQRPLAATPSGAPPRRGGHMSALVRPGRGSVPATNSLLGDALKGLCEGAINPEVLAHAKMRNLLFFSDEGCSYGEVTTSGKRNRPMSFLLHSFPPPRNLAWQTVVGVGDRVVCLALLTMVVCLFLLADIAPWATLHNKKSCYASLSTSASNRLAQY